MDSTNSIKSRRKWTRRSYLGGAGLAGAAAALYGVAPWFWHRYTREMTRPVARARHRPRPQDWPDRGIQVAWLGHSTVLLKIDGFTILTDPVLTTRAGIHLGPITLGIKRLVEPALELEDLPLIDLVLVSHAHMDHLDTWSLARLENRHRSMVMAPSTSDLVRVRRYKEVRELKWGEEARFGPVTVKAFQVNHWGARMRSDTYRGYNGYTIESGKRRILFAGDTADTHLFKSLRTSKQYDLAVMPIGAYNPWIRYHCTPEQALRMANEANAERLIPVHHQTFELSREPGTEPIERFLAAACSEPERVVITEIGQEFRS